MKIFNQTSDDEAEMLIYDAIGSDLWFDAVSAKSFKAELDDLGDVKKIRVRINSEGGDVFDGFTIHNLLKHHPAAVDVIVDGLAASIASVVAMAGDTVEMATGSMMMIHNPWGLAVGDAQECRRVANVLDKLSDNIVDVYEAKSGEKPSTLRSLMDAETWLTAKEAVDIGLADAISADLAIAASVHSDRYRNVPACLKRPSTRKPNEHPESTASALAQSQRQLALTRARMRM